MGFLFGGSPTPPRPPDPVETAQAQAGFNREAIISSAEVNQINQQTPFGSVEFSGAIGSPDRTQTITLSPDEQAKLDLRNALISGVGDFGLQQLEGLPTDPLTAEGLPDRITRVGGPQIQRQLDPSNINLTGSFDAPGVNTNVFGQPGFSEFGGSPGQLQLGLGTGDFAGERQRVEDTIFDRLSGRIDERSNLERSRLEQTLADRGLPVGSEASKQAIREVEQRRGDQIANAQAQAIGLGGQESSRLFGQQLQTGQFGNLAQGQGFGQTLAGLGFNNQLSQQGFGNQLAGQAAQNAAIGQQFGQNEALAQFQNQASGMDLAQLLSRGAFANAASGQQFDRNLTRSTFANQARDAQLSEEQNLRNQQLSELQFALGSTGTTQAPAANPIASFGQASPDLIGLVGDQFAAQSRTGAANTGAFADIAGAALPFLLSDERVKKDVTKIGETPDGINIVAFRYLWDRDDMEAHIGVIAQDVAKIRPDAVVTGDDGFMYVNYGLIPEVNAYGPA